MAQFYKAIREGFDGRQIRKPGEVFPFAGRRGSWMVPCSEDGKVRETVAAQRETRLGTNQAKTLSREELREECRKLGIAFKATQGAIDLAELIQKHEASKAGTVAEEEKPASSENPDGGSPGVGTGEGAGSGTGNLEVL